MSIFCYILFALALILAGLYFLASWDWKEWFIIALLFFAIGRTFEKP